MVRQYGADILRLWVAQTDYTVDQRIGPEILKGTADSYRRLRNTLRFLLGALDGFAEAERVDAGGDARARALGAAPAGRARPARCATATPPTTSSACSSRSSSSAPSTSRRSTSTSARTRSTATPRRARAGGRRARVLDALFHRLVTWLAPMLAFTMEEVWLERFPGEDSSVHLVDFPDDAGGLARPRARRRSGRRSAAPAASSPARSRSSGATSASAPASRRRRWSTSPTPALRAALALGRLRRRLHHLGPDADRRAGPGGRLHARRRPRRRGGARGSPTARNARAAGRSCPTSAPTRIPGVCARCDAALVSKSGLVGGGCGAGRGGCGSAA